MRTFYIYDVNELCYDMYQNYPYQLYKIFEDIYYTSKYNKRIAISSYDGIIQKFNKQFVHDFLLVHFRLNHFYHYKNGVHTISNYQEYSRLLVSSYSLKIIITNNYSNFLKEIDKYSECMFVCDFKNNDYFWLHKVVKKNLIKE